MQRYLQCLKQRPSIQSVQLAGCTLLHFLFLLLHALQASHHHLQSTTAQTSAHTSRNSDQPKLAVQLPDLTDNAIGDMTCADAQWCPVDTTLRRIGETIRSSAAAIICGNLPKSSVTAIHHKHHRCCICLLASLTSCPVLLFYAGTFPVHNMCTVTIEMPVMLQEMIRACHLLCHMQPVLCMCIATASMF